MIDFMNQFNESIGNSKETLIPIIPEHLVIDNILPRLPVKTLTRFKIVSKLWFSIISSVDFAKTHLKFSSLSPRFVVLTVDKRFTGSHELHFLASDDNNSIKMRNLDLDLGLGFDLNLGLDSDSNLVIKTSYLVGCCNGLLCFYFNVEKVSPFGYFCVWNPVTGQRRNIMNPVGLRAVCYGFSYASSIDDYKIVGSFLDEDCVDDIYYISLRSRKWKPILGLLFRDNYLPFSNSLIYPDKSLEIWKEDKFIVGFDLVEEKRVEIRGVDWLSRYNEASFVDWKEHVALFCRGDHGSDLWVLKKNGDWNSWDKVYSFKSLNLSEMVFCSLTETGKCLVKKEQTTGLIVVDLHRDVTAEYEGVIDLSDNYDPDDDAAAEYAAEYGEVIDFSENYRGSGVYIERLIYPVF